MHSGVREREYNHARCPGERARSPGAIAAAAVYLASDEAAFVHGAVLDIDGGRVNVLTSADAAVRP
jgi:NAD(P)-dependent dehydrogenase (short-subunit alcohol dehydrogenase family)